MSRAGRAAGLRGAGELIQRAAMLDYVADNQIDVLGQLEVAKVAQANADSAARAARDEMAAAEDAAAAAKAEADAQLAAAAERLRAGRRAEGDYDQQLQAAQIHLLELQGARNAYQAVGGAEGGRGGSRPRRGRGGGRASGGRGGGRRERQPAAAAAAAAAVAVAVAQSATTSCRRRAGHRSCYGWRWGAPARRRGHRRPDRDAHLRRDVRHRRSAPGRRPASAWPSTSSATTAAVTVYGHVNRVLRLTPASGCRPASRSPRSATAASRPARTCTSRCTPAARCTAARSTRCRGCAPGGVDVGG